MRTIRSCSGCRRDTAAARRRYRLAYARGWPASGCICSSRRWRNETMSFGRVEQEMAQAVQRGVFPGAVLLVRAGTHVFYLRAFGSRQVEPTRAPMAEDTIFDLS